MSKGLHSADNQNVATHPFREPADDSNTVDHRHARPSALSECLTRRCDREIHVGLRCRRHRSDLASVVGRADLDEIGTQGIHAPAADEVLREIPRHDNQFSATDG